MTPLISYAQNGEDVVLHRLFRDQPFGRYVDIGAGHPEFDSVTKLFYDQGWRGINIEPSPTEFALLETARPDDVNLAVAVADYTGTAVLYLGGETERGLGTLDHVIAEHSLTGDVQTFDVPVTTLARICLQYVAGPIDFLKIDVEGVEQQVIAGADWVAYRPRVVIVEATEPNSTVPTHHKWEPDLLGAGYVFVLFDGLNRFYVGEDDLEARGILSVPAGVHDGFIRNDLRLLAARVLQLEEDNRELHRRLQIANWDGATREATQSSPVWYRRSWDDDSDLFLDVSAAEER